MKSANLYCIAHRGASGHEPENTIRAIRTALALGAPAIEVDVHLVEDRHLLVIHDRRLERTTSGRGELREHSFAELRSLDAGKGEKIPTLEEVIEAIDGRAELILELKSENTASAVLQVLERYSGGNATRKEQFLISSFDHCQMAEAKALAPDIRRAPVVTGVPIGYAAFAVDLDPYSIHVSFEFVRRGFIEDAHRRGFKVFAFTVNHWEEIRWMEDLGVDGVFTDSPELILCG